MLNFFQSIFLAILQGVSELFPVSSLGHSVVVPTLFKWSIQQDSTLYLAFLVMLHLGTSIALIWYYRNDWIAVIQGFIRTVQNKKIGNDTYEHLAWLLISGTIPVGLLGLLLEKKVKSLFVSPAIAAAFLIVNGFILLFGEKLRKGTEQKPLKTLQGFSYVQAGIVGICQSFALIPGISRSGASIVGGLIQGLNHEDSAKFSFMLAAPAILLASLLEIHYLFHTSGTFITALISGIVAGICAYVSTKFLVKYFQSGTLLPFAYYCWIFGLIAFFMLKFLY